MKSFLKFFIALIIVTTSSNVYCGVTGMAETNNSLPMNQEKRLQELKKLYEEIPNLKDKEAVTKYLKTRLSKITRENIDAKDLNNPSSTSIVVPEEIRAKEQNTLSAYEKIYEESMRQAGNTTDTINQDVELTGTFYKLKQPEINTSQFVPDFPYVKVKLSDTREILAPADEHFPYVLTSIGIEPTGLLHVTEDFTFISNNESFPYGFFRILPKYSYSRNGEKRRIDLELVSVTINEKNYPYKITEVGNYLYIEPKEQINLPTGIYRYQFKYIIDRAVWYFDNYDELYWDITAKTLKNVVGSANAVVALPTGKTFIAQNAIASTKNGLNPQRVTITTLSENSLGFADTEALGVGEDIHLFLTMEKGTLLPPDFSKKYQWFIHDYGANLFALITLLAIMLSYRISLSQIQRNKDKTRIYTKKTPAIYRLLNQNTFDNISLGSEILNLQTKNILTYQENNEKISLIKKSDNLKKLSKVEQKLIQILYPGQETKLNEGIESALKLKRAYNYLRFQTYKQLYILKLKLNAMYITFSLAMLLFEIVSSSSLSINPLNTCITITIFTLSLFPLVTIISINFKSRIIKYLVRLLLFIVIFWIVGILSIYSSALYAILQLLIVYLITYYNRLFSKRSGLLRNKIKETEEYKNYLQKNPEIEQNSKDIISKIPYIYTFGLIKLYPNIKELEYTNRLISSISSNEKRKI